MTFRGVAALVALASMLAVAAPVRAELWFTKVVTEESTITIEVEPLGLEAETPIAVPVPVAVGNTVPGLTTWLAGANVPLAGEANDAAPQDENLATRDSILAPLALLPDSGVTLAVSSQADPYTYGLYTEVFGPTAEVAGIATTAPDTAAHALDAILEGGLGTLLDPATSGADPLAYGGPGTEPPAPLPYAPANPERAGSPAEPIEATSAVAASSTTIGGEPAAARVERAKAAAAVTAALALPTLLGWALYHRIRGHSTLDNGTRKTIFDAVAERPGLGVQEIADLASVSYSTASYHLDRLVDARMIILAQEGSRLRYYKNGGGLDETERKVLPLLRNAEAMRVLTTILENPGTYRAAIAEKMGVTPTTVNWHLKRLVEAGLIRETRAGRNAYLDVDRERLHALVSPLLPKLENAESPAADVARRVMAPSAGPAIAPLAA